MNSSEQANIFSVLNRIGSKVLKTRAIVRLPISLFKWGLGFILGADFTEDGTGPPTVHIMASGPRRQVD